MTNGDIKDEKPEPDEKTTTFRVTMSQEFLEEIWNLPEEENDRWWRERGYVKVGRWWRKGH